jgi:hypothetical protein
MDAFAPMTIGPDKNLRLMVGAARTLVGEVVVGFGEPEEQKRVKVIRYRLE